MPSKYHLALPLTLNRIGRCRQAFTQKLALTSSRLRNTYGSRVLAPVAEAQRIRPHRTPRPKPRQPPYLTVTSEGRRNVATPAGTYANFPENMSHGFRNPDKDQATMLIIFTPPGRHHGELHERLRDGLPGRL